MSKPIPVKTYWMGEDIETLPRERLIEIVHDLARDLRETQEHALSAIKTLQGLHRRAHGQSEDSK